MVIFHGYLSHNQRVSKMSCTKQSSESAKLAALAEHRYSMTDRTKISSLRWQTASPYATIVDASLMFRENSGTRAIGTSNYLVVSHLGP